MSQTQRAREVAEEIAREFNGGDREDCRYPEAWIALMDDPSIANEKALADWLETIILRAINGSDQSEYRRGVEDAAKVVDERIEFWDKGKSNMFGILLITETQQCATAIRALTTEQGVSGEPNYARAIETLRSLRNTTDPDEIKRQKESWAMLEEALKPVSGREEGGDVKENETMPDSYEFLKQQKDQIESRQSNAITPCNGIPCADPAHNHAEWKRGAQHAAVKILNHIEFIDTTRIAASGFSKEATAISAARVTADRFIDSAPAPDTRTREIFDAGFDSAVAPGKE